MVCVCGGGGGGGGVGLIHWGGGGINRKDPKIVYSELRYTYKIDFFLCEKLKKIQ